MITWKVRKGHDKRVKSKHPWVFSNELTQSPKGHLPGHPVELVDESNNFVALGYGNPHSLIAFRALSFLKDTKITTDYLLKKIIKAWSARVALGFQNSYRIVFSENDELSGLIVDLYAIEQNGKKGYAFVAQMSTAGIEHLISDRLEFFKKLHTMALEEKLITTPWSHVCVVMRNDTQFRKREGLEVEPAQIVKGSDFFDLNSITIHVSSSFDQSPLDFQVDLIKGQKTGFFLDQTRNIEIVLSQLNKMKELPKELRILDLCCYMGHWSVQIAHFCKVKGIKLHVTAVDISEKALEAASANISKIGVESLEIVKQDILDNLNIPGEFDVVICDPPALIKNTKSLPIGQHAYMKLNSNALKLVKKNGFMATCSCSGLLIREEFMNALRKSFHRSEKEAYIIAEGGHAGDHPHLPSFPEGFYLKMFLVYVP